MEIKKLDQIPRLLEEIRDQIKLSNMTNAMASDNIGIQIFNMHLNALKEKEMRAEDKCTEIATEEEALAKKAQEEKSRLVSERSKHLDLCETLEQLKKQLTHLQVEPKILKEEVAGMKGRVPEQVLQALQEMVKRGDTQALFEKFMNMGHLSQITRHDPKWNSDLEKEALKQRSELKIVGGSDSHLQSKIGNLETQIKKQEAEIERLTKSVRREKAEENLKATQNKTQKERKKIQGNFLLRSINEKRLGQLTEALRSTDK